MLAPLRRGSDARVQPARTTDPAATHTESFGVDDVVRRIVQRRAGAPRTAELVATRLAQVYGPFSASNSAQNRRAIIDNLLWIGGTGIRYDQPRADGPLADTQSPNQTLSLATGVCRDTHTALGAILSALMNAREEKGVWVPGPPSNDAIRTIGFSNPQERHAYLVYRDPGSGKWNALEYDSHYELQSASDIDAFALLPNFVPSFRRYAISGWDGKPTIAERDFAHGARARDFFLEDPGVGRAGEIRLNASASDARLTVFVTPRLSLQGAVDPSATSEGFRGGARLNYHRDFTTRDAVGYCRVGAGAYRDFFDASATGERGAGARKRFSQWIIGGQANGRIQGEASLGGEHLQLSWGSDANLFLARPITSGNAESDWRQYSEAVLGFDLGLRGAERLASSLHFEWALRYRHRLDIVAGAASFNMSGSSELATALGVHNGVVQGAAAVTYAPSSGVSLRAEAGADMAATSLYGMSGSHYLALSVSTKSDAVSGGMLLTGRSEELLSSAGAAISVRPLKWLTLGVGTTATGAGVSFFGTAGGRF